MPSFKNYTIEYLAAEDYFDEQAGSTGGTSFIWRLTADEIPASNFYYYIDMHLPIVGWQKARARKMDVTAAWLSGGGFIMADAQEGIDAWSTALTTGFNRAQEIKEPVYKEEGKFQMDVYFEEGDEIKSVPLTEGFDPFFEKFQIAATKLVKLSKIRYLLNNMNPIEIVAMISEKDLIKAFDRMAKIVSSLQTAPDVVGGEQDDLSEFENEPEEVEPSPEELEGIESGDEEEVPEPVEEEEPIKVPGKKLKPAL